MATNSILISGIGKRNLLLDLFVEECAQSNIEVIGGDARDNPPARSSVSQFVDLPTAQHPDFKSSYAKVLQEHATIAHLTLIDPEITALGAMEEDFQDGESTLINSARGTSELCEDKFALHEHLASHSIPVIPTYLSPLDDGPFIRKDRRGSAASGFRVVRGHDGLEALATGPDLGRREPIFQPLVTDEHFCIDAYFSLATGNLRDFCAKQVLDKKHGESYLLRAVGREPFMGLMERVAEVLDLRGFVNLDIYGASAPRIMEINCRIGGNYPASHAFGANLISLLIQEVTGGAGAAEGSFSRYRTDLHVAKYFAFTPPYA